MPTRQKPTGPQITSFQEIELANNCFENDFHCYATHDNGGCPFVVQVRKDKRLVRIYEATYTKQTKQQTSTHMIQQEIETADNHQNGGSQKIIRQGLYYMEEQSEDGDDGEAYFYALIKEIDYQQQPFEIYIGIDNTAEVFPDNAYPILFPGAATLIRFTTTSECWFLCTCLTKFTLHDENIQALYSPIGNNDVIYPYMMTDSKCYIFEGDSLYSIDKKVLANSRVPGEDIYDHYYSETTSVLWTKTQCSYCSERVTLKRYYNDPTVPLINI